MIGFPHVSGNNEVPLARMSLAEYAAFSERCLRSNPAITPLNCLTKRADERFIGEPFCLRRETAPLRVRETADDRSRSSSA